MMMSIAAYVHLSPIGKVLIWVLLFLCLVQLVHWNNNHEGFTNDNNNNNNSHSVEVEDPYTDDWYVSLYDVLFFNKEHHAAEQTILHQFIVLPTMGTIVDLGCGTGYWVTALETMYPSYPVVGIDRSPLLIQQCKGTTTGKATFRVGDITNPRLLSVHSAALLTCFYFTVYYLSREQQHDLFRHAWSWLRPQGWFVVHLVDPHKFDTRNQHVPEQGNTVALTSHVYRSEYHDHDYDPVFNEHITTHTGHETRHYHHALHMQPVAAYKQWAKEIGFTSVSAHRSGGYPHHFLLCMCKR